MTALARAHAAKQRRIVVPATNDCLSVSCSIADGRGPTLADHALNAWIVVYARRHFSAHGAGLSHLGAAVLLARLKDNAYQEIAEQVRPHDHSRGKRLAAHRGQIEARGRRSGPAFALA